MSDELQGVDTSKWQGEIDWHTTKDQIDFALIKATQGTAEVDPNYASDLAALRHARELRGSYHYPNAGDPAAEARFYVEHADRHNGEMQALDFEGAVLNLPDPVGWAEAWLREVIERTNNRPLIYMSGSVVTRFDWRRVIALNIGLWVASWDTAPVHHIGQWPFAIAWQRNDDGHLAGIDGNVDQDVFFGDADLWRTYAHNIDGPPAHEHHHHHPKPAPKPHHGDHDGHEPKRYTVKAGDTLTGIANHHGVAMHELVAANVERYPSIGWNPDLIQIGWHLTIPAG